MTRWTPNTSDLDPGIHLAVSGSSATGDYTVEYTGPGAPFGTSWTAAGWTSVTATVEVTEIHVYNVGGGYSVEFAVEVFVQGVSELTSTYSGSPTLLGPSYIDILAMPWKISGSCAASTSGLPSYAWDDVYSYLSTCTSTATGGREFKYADEASWTSLPVTHPPGSAPSLGGDCDDPDLTEITATNQGNVSIVSYMENGGSSVLHDSGNITACTIRVYCDGVLIDTITTGGQSVPWEQYRRSQKQIRRAGTFWGIGDLEKKIKRFNTDFKALLYRAEFPQTTSALFAECVSIVGDVTTTTTSSTTPEVHPFADFILDEVEATEGALEDVLLEPSYSGKSTSGIYEETITYESNVTEEGVLCPTVGVYPSCDAGILTTEQEFVDGWEDLPEESHTGTRTYLFPATVGTDIAEYLDHDEADARYFNSWCNPHWSFGRDREEWEVDGTPLTKEDWDKFGSQYINNAAASIDTNTRNHLWSEALANDGNGAFLDTAFGGLRWPGVHRFVPRVFEPLTSYTYDSESEDLWTGEDCTLSFGADITINPSSPTCRVKLALGSFTISPFLAVHLANKWLCDWTVDNVESVKVYLEGADGTRVLLNDNDPGALKSVPAGKTTEYAGSWAQDFGAGVVTDLGSDHAPTTGGVSSAVMGDAHRSTAFQMLADRTASFLVFDIEVTDDTVDCNIDYPTFEYTLSESRKIVWENAHQCAILHPNGPGVRTGHFDTGDSGTLTIPPTVYDPTERSNSVDGLIVGRLLVEGIAHDDGLTTELTTLYDTTEGNGVGPVRNNSHFFWLPVTSADWIMAVVNSMSEIPPLCEFPLRERNATTWVDDGDFVQHVWVAAQGPDYFVNPSQSVDLREDDDLAVWTGSATVFSGWHITSHTHAVDNTETDFGVWAKSIRYGVVRPFRGGYSVIVASVVYSSLWNAISPVFRFYSENAIGDDGAILHSYSQFGAPPIVRESTLEDADEARHAVDHRETVVYVAAIDGEIKRFESYDNGKTLNDMGVFIENAIHPHICFHPYFGHEIAAGFRYDSGDSGPGKIVLRIRKPGGVASAEFFLGDGILPFEFEDDTFGITFTGTGQAEAVLLARKSGEDDVTRFVSYSNGLTWAEV